MREKRSLSGRRRLEREEADFVLGDVRGSFEANARPLPRQLLGCRARPPLARRSLPGGTTSEIRSDEVARHIGDGTRGAAR